MDYFNKIKAKPPSRGKGEDVLQSLKQWQEKFLNIDWWKEF